MSDEVKPIILVVHGMGKHAAGDFKAEFIAAANKALNRYPKNKTSKVEDLAEIHEINYDGFFDEIRKKMADRAKPIAERLTSIEAIHGLSWGPELVLKLSNIEAKFGDDEFLYTHILDVVFYMTLLGGKVRTDVAHQIATTIENNAEARIHIVAHSLGTAVVHDTLALLYRQTFDASDKIPDLDPVVHKLRSVWMVANVSKLVHCVTNLIDPYKSTVKPVPQGCTMYLNNVRHELDPFTWPARYDPKDDGDWIPTEYYQRAYKNIETSVVRELNTHSFTQYIENPRVALPLFERILQLDVLQADADEVFDDYQKSDISGAFDELKEALVGINITDVGTLMDLVDAAKVFRETVDEFEAQLAAFNGGSP